jgi:hypothetical protein
VIITAARLALCCSHLALQVGHVHVAAVIALGDDHLMPTIMALAGLVPCALLGIRQMLR